MKGSSLHGLTLREAFGINVGIVSEEPLASSISSQIILRGGNSVDASIAMSFALAVIVPHLGGIGGDYFALIRRSDGSIEFINGSGFAPRGLKRQLFLEKGLKNIPSRGPLSITVPGFIDALYKLWRREGTLEWRELLLPAINLARKGFPAPPALTRALKRHKDLLMKDPGSRQTYLENGPEKPGDKVAFPGLASMLEEISEDPRCFYEGEIAEKIEEYIIEHGGVLTKDDMKIYEASFDDPVNIEYKDWKIWEMPPNTQGLTTLHMIKILEQWKLPKNPRERLYYILSASRAAYAVRDRELGDPRYMNMKPQELLSEEYIEVLKTISREGPLKCSSLTRRGAGYGDTTFYAVADKEGSLVAGIQSLYYPFGSGLTEPSFQVTLNGRASGFTLEDNRPNTLKPLKKPLHTLSAVIATNSDRTITLGTSGGHYRPQQHALLLTSMIDHGVSLGEAIAMPRLLWTPWTCNIIVDPWIRALNIPQGYQVSKNRTGVANIIYRDNNALIAATDPRGDGYPIVF